MADPTRRLALAVADAGWFTTDHLFAATPESRASTLLLTCSDYGNAWRRGARPWGPGWGSRTVLDRPGLWRRDLVLPPGWMKRAPRLGMRPIARAVRSWNRRHAANDPLALVMTYPYYLTLRDQLRPAIQIYYNVDDYTLYWPGSAVEVRRLERRAVRETDLTICVAAIRAEELREAEPAHAHKIRHLPHGAPPGSIDDRAWVKPAPTPEDIASLPRPRIGYVGSMSDRVDWNLITQLARALPDASLILIGRIDGEHPPARAEFLALPNVHAIGWRAQGEIAAYNRAFDVNLIPYRVDHPFNVACCPTKINDLMGSGRPIVSTDLPECRLGRHLFDVAGSSTDFIESVRQILGSGSDDGRAVLRREHALANTCERTVGRLLDWLPGAG